MYLKNKFVNNKTEKIFEVVMKMENKDFFLIKKCDGLHGEVTVSGCKNAALPIMAACLLIDGKITLQNVPDLTDVTAMCEILECFGAKIIQNKKNTIEINAEKYRPHHSTL